MSPEDQRRVDEVADLRLQELEDLELSREEILYKGTEKRGIKLGEDPFFQYVKDNKDIRKILIKEGEEYSVDRIVSIALRQEIGLDTAASVHPKLLYDPSRMNEYQKWE